MILKDDQWIGIYNMTLIDDEFSGTVERNCEAVRKVKDDIKKICSW